MSGLPFDPRQHLGSLSIDDRSIPYLEVTWRLVWLRQSHPDAHIVTEHTRLDGDQAVMRATITVPGHGSATGYGSATADETPRFVERAESRAIGRALLLLGFGAEYSADFILEPAATAPAVAAPAVAAPSLTAPAATAPAVAAPTSRPAVASSPSTVQSTPPAAATTPPRSPSLPAGISIGPAGRTTLTPRLAAAFAQAQPIEDEPEPIEAEPPATTAAPTAAPTAPRATPADSPRPAIATASLGDDAPTSGHRGALTERPAPSRVPPATGAERPSASTTATPHGRPLERLAVGPTGDAASRLEADDDETDDDALHSGRPGRSGTHARAAEADLPTRLAGRWGRSSFTRSTPPSSDNEFDETGDEEAREAEPVDSDWTSFWRWARRKGFNNREEIEQALGQTIRGLTPRELRGLLVELED